MGKIVKVQSMFRMMKAKKTVELERKRQKEKKEKVVKIQAFFRGHFLRKQMALFKQNTLNKHLGLEEEKMSESGQILVGSIKRALTEGV